MLKIALTGGIGSGKSKVCEYFTQFGVPIVSADAISREILSPKNPAYTDVCTHFGEKILNEDRLLDREKLRELIFQDSKARQWLEKLLHPLIRQDIARRLTKLNNPYAIIDIPLLCETGYRDDIDRVLVVDVPREIQIARTCIRDKVTPDHVEKILTAQASREQRLRIADDVIDNSGDLVDLAKQVGALHAKYSSYC